MWHIIASHFVCWARSRPFINAPQMCHKHARFPIINSAANVNVTCAYADNSTERAASLLIDLVSENSLWTGKLFSTIEEEKSMKVSCMMAHMLSKGRQNTWHFVSIIAASIHLQEKFTRIQWGGRMWMWTVETLSSYRISFLKNSTQHCESLLKWIAQHGKASTSRGRFEKIPLDATAVIKFRSNYERFVLASFAKVSLCRVKTSRLTSTRMPKCRFM